MPGLQNSLHHVPYLEVGDILTRCLRRRLEFGHDQITAAMYSTILHMLSSIKQQVRVTNFALSLSPRENAGSHGARAGDSTYNTTNADCRFLHEFHGVRNRLGNYHNEREERFEIFVPIQIHKAVLPLVAGSFTSFLVSQVESAAGIVRITRTRRGRLSPRLLLMIGSP